MVDHDPQAIERIVASIKGSRKYRDTYEETIRALAAVEIERHKRIKTVEKAVRRRLHLIVAAHLGDPDYDQAEAALAEAYAQGPEQARAACRAILAAHVSTRERLPLLDAFYPALWALTGTPRVVLDVACALHPLALPWMGLAAEARYYAYDLQRRRVTFLNRFFALAGRPPLARLQDVALEPPAERGDVALFFKELHRYERNYEGAGLALLRALPVRYLCVSFPAVSLHGGRDLSDHYRRYFQDLIAGEPWRIVGELVYETEIVFCVEK
jgi:16S rRNA (guanine(1405)-N(7))-methyltransferase